MNKRFDSTQEEEICSRYNTPLANGDLPTAMELAVTFDCSDGTIRNIVKKHGLDVRRNRGRQSPRMFSAETEIEICEYYWTRLPSGYYPSYKETGNAFGCSFAYVRGLLKKHGYKHRTNAETRDKRPCKPINKPDSPAPLCACGCGRATQWKSKDRYWTKYAKGHYRDAQRALVQNEESKPWEQAPMPHGWKKLSREIKHRDKWKCQLCHKRFVSGSGYLHVHHIDEDKTHNHPHNLISLCATCHAPAHGKDEMRPRLVEIATANSEAMPDGWVTWEIHASPSMPSRHMP